MSVANYRALRQKIGFPTQRIRVVKAGSAPAGATAGTNTISEWTSSGGPTIGVAPTTAVTCDNTTAGSAGQGNKAGSEQRCWLECFDIPFANALNSGCLLLVDRLVHNGGLSGIVTTQQTNGAWPALPRFTSGVGVWGALQIYTGIGATNTNFTVNYTNSAGTAARTSQTVAVGGGGLNSARRLLPFSLQSGDVGVKSIEGVTLAATTGTAGNFGMTLFKTLAMWPCTDAGIAYARSGEPPNFLYMPPVPDGACLELLWLGTPSGGSTVIGGNLSFFED